MINLYRYSTLCVGFLVLIGCASIPEDKVNQRLFAWKGQKIEDLVKYWGLPSKQQQLDGKSYSEWINQSSEPGNTSVSIGSGRHSRHSGIGIGFTLFDLGSTDDACSRLVTYSEQGIVTDISWQGTNNYCYEITPELAEVQANNAAIQTEQ